MKKYILACPAAMAAKLLLQLSSWPHFVECSDRYSVQDLLDSDDSLIPDLVQVHSSWAQHIKTECQVRILSESEAMVQLWLVHEMILKIELNYNCLQEIELLYVFSWWLWEIGISAEHDDPHFSFLTSFCGSSTNASFISNNSLKINYRFKVSVLALSMFCRVEDVNNYFW